MVAIETPSVIASCGATLHEGDRAYNHYDRKPGVVGLLGAFSDGWFDFFHDDGTRKLLNGPRVCSMQYARLRGFQGADPV